MLESKTWKKEPQKHGGVFDPETRYREIESLETVTGEPGFWNNREHAEKTLNKLKSLRQGLEPWNRLVTETKNLKELFNLAVEENDESFENEILEGIEKLEKDYEDLILIDLLNDEADSKDAFLTIHSGAGGTEACDWTQMLYRMYSRWARTGATNSRFMTCLKLKEVLNL